MFVCLFVCLLFLAFNDVDDDETRNGGGKCPDFRPHWGLSRGQGGEIKDNNCVVGERKRIERGTDLVWATGTTSMMMR